jgi:hypothetical protein
MMWFRGSNDQRMGKTVEEAGGVYFENYFHCTDLGTQLIPVIAQFKQHAEGFIRCCCASFSPNAPRRACVGPNQATSVLAASRPIAPNVAVGAPPVIKFDEWIDDKQARGPGVYPLALGAEMQVHLLVGSLLGACWWPGVIERWLTTRATGDRLRKVLDGNLDTFLWQIRGEMDVHTHSGASRLHTGDMLSLEEPLESLGGGATSVALLLQNTTQPPKK